MQKKRRSKTTPFLLLGLMFCVVVSVVISVYLSNSRQTTTTSVGAASALAADQITNALKATGKARVIVQYPYSTNQLTTPQGRSALLTQNVTTKKQVIAALANTRYTIRREYKASPAIALEIDSAAYQKLLSLKNQRVIKSVFPDTVQSPLIYESRNIVGADVVENGIVVAQTDSRLQSNASVAADGSGTVVAVVGGGVDPNHVFLTGKIAGEYCSGTCPDGQSTQVGPGAAVQCPSALSTDTWCKHETGVSGILSGNQTIIPASALGTPGNQAAAGVAKGSKILAMRVVSQVCTETSCAWVAYLSDILNALDWLYTTGRTQHNVVAVNLSLGGVVDPYTQYCDEVTPYTPIVNMLDSVGVTVVAGSGNGGRSVPMIAPACIKASFPVGSSNKLDQLADHTSVSTHPYLVLAPGVKIWTSLPSQYAPKAWTNVGGTSYATPHVSGAVAVLNQLAPKIISTIGYKEAIVKTAKNISAEGKVYKRLQLQEAVKYLYTIENNYCWNKVVPFNNTLRWGTPCGGVKPGPYDTCIQILGPTLTEYETIKYNDWVAKGKIVIPGCQ